MTTCPSQPEHLDADGQTADSGARLTAREGGSRTTDGGIPPLVIRGESLEESKFPDSGEKYQLVSENGKAVLIAHPLPKPDGVPYSAITDYLNCTFPHNPSDNTRFFSRLFSCLGDRFAPAIERGRPLHFYADSYSLGTSSALFAHGRQGGILSLSGEACHLVPDWKELIVLLRDELGGHVSRWDGAVDDFHGVHNVDLALQMYDAGEFNSGGNEPTCEQRGNWRKPDGKGRTLYIGKRQNGKMARIYEKGMQLGAPWHPWVRWEIELHNADRVIPFEVLLEPGRYVAGAYPALSWVQEEMERIRTIQKTGQISYNCLIHHASNAYGKLINTMIAVEGSAEKVLEKLRRDGIPARLDTPSLTGFGK